MKNYLRAITLLFLVWLTVAVQAAPGDLDLSFGSGGIVVTPITNAPNLYERPKAIQVQPDGKIVVCGEVNYDDGETGYEVSTFLARYHPNGTLDASFGAGGKVIFNSSSHVGFNMALQPDGKIITVGYTFPGNLSFAVYRFNPNGTLDSSFGTGGRVFPQVRGGAQDVAVQPDGKIIVVGNGNAFTTNDNDFAVVRLNPNGSLDNSFGAGGIVTVEIRTGRVSDEPGAVLLQPDGKIVVVGTSLIVGSRADYALARFNPNGTLDFSFGENGKIIHSFSNSVRANDAALQADGKIVVAGAGITRYNVNGSVDTSFADNGIFSPTDNFFVGWNVAVQPDGKIAAFGSGVSGELGGFAVARLNLNGSPDAGFGANGRLVTPIGTNESSYAAAGAIQPDGKILAFGLTRAPDGEHLALVRYLGDSAASTATKFDFDGDGRADISVFRTTHSVWYLNRSSQGFSATQFGLSTDRITPADYDGDGKTDITVYREGFWYWLNSSNGNFQGVHFGQTGDIPVPADFDGDGRAEIAVYRGGTWFTLNLTNNQFQTVQFGNSTDKPVVGDFDGDNRADYVVFRDGTWFLLQSTQGFAAIQFGLPTDKLVPADYDGDGKTDVAVYRNGTWYLLQSLQGFTAFQFGNASDIPAPADYDGDGRADAAVYREGTWYLRQSTNGFAAQQFGLASDKPVPTAYSP